MFQIVGRPAKLTCNYVKFRTESVREIAWFAGYNGINTKVHISNSLSYSWDGVAFSKVFYFAQFCHSLTHFFNDWPTLEFIIPPHYKTLIFCIEFGGFQFVGPFYLLTFSVKKISTKVSTDKTWKAENTNRCLLCNRLKGQLAFMPFAVCPALTWILIQKYFWKCLFRFSFT